VPLDEYYYGKREGDPAYNEDKGEFRFKVSSLEAVFLSNAGVDPGPIKIGGRFFQLKKC
jgi:hypothetical protein